ENPAKKCTATARASRFAMRFPGVDGLGQELQPIEPRQARAGKVIYHHGSSPLPCRRSVIDPRSSAKHRHFTPRRQTSFSLTINKIYSLIMSLRLPSITALRMFEATSRHASFTKAAAELHVTQAPVSHQLRALEQQLGIKLFQRSTRRLSLTPAGQRLLPAVSDAFETLGRAVADIGRGERLLSITTTPSFGARWLAPRLRRFAAAYSHIQLPGRHSHTHRDAR